MAVRELRLVRLNPNVTFKTRGNAAISITVDWSPATAFEMACRAVEEYADMDCENTNPGVVVESCRLDPGVLPQSGPGLLQDRRGGATAHLGPCDLQGIQEQAGSDRSRSGGRERISGPYLRTPGLPGRRPLGDPPGGRSGEHLPPRTPTPSPHTWDSVDRENRVVVCVPHSPDPVLFGIRGERPGWLSLAREHIVSEKPSLEQVFVTNQGTDAHLREEAAGLMKEGCSYILRGTVASPPLTAKGGHVSFSLECDEDVCVQCMAYEPTKGFREVVRCLLPGDLLVVAGGAHKIREHQPGKNPNGQGCRGSVGRQAPGLRAVRQENDQRRDGQRVQVQEVRGEEQGRGDQPGPPVAYPGWTSAPYRTASPRPSPLPGQARE